MSPRISEMLAHISWGLARPNRFIVEISPPKVMWVSGVRARKLSALTEITELPGKHFATLERRTYGPVRKMPYAVVYNDLPMTFICTANMDERRFFDKWQAKISDPKSYYFEYYDDYTATIKIKPVDESGFYWYSMTLFEAYPLTIQPQSLNQGENDTYLKMNVVFAFRNFITYDQESVEPTSVTEQENQLNKPIDANPYITNDTQPEPVERWETPEYGSESNRGVSDSLPKDATIETTAVISSVKDTKPVIPNTGGGLVRI